MWMQLPALCRSNLAYHLLSWGGIAAGHPLDCTLKRVAAPDGALCRAHAEGCSCWPLQLPFEFCWEGLRVAEHERLHSTISAVSFLATVMGR